MGNMKDVYNASITCNPASHLTDKFKCSDTIIALVCPNDARFTEFFGNSVVHIIPVHLLLSFSCY